MKNELVSLRPRKSRGSWKLVSVAAGLVLTAMTLAGCGGDGDQADAASHDTVTVKNCGEEVSYETPVKRVMATSNSANIGTLLRIGAGPQLASISLNEGNDEILTKLYGFAVDKIPHLEDSSDITMETIIAKRPDLLIGSYSGLFSGSHGVTVRAAHDNDIPTYIISDSCRQTPEAGSKSRLGTMGPWDAVRSDLKNYGVLTGNKSKASKAREELDDRLKDLKSAPQATEKPRVLLYDSGTDDAYTSGSNGPPNGIIEAAGGQNVFNDHDTTWFDASWESVAKSKPDAIVVMDYRSGDPNEIKSKKQTLRNQPSLKRLPVVKQDRITSLPLTLFTSGYPNIEAAEQLRKALERHDLVPESDIKPELKLDK